MNDRPCFKIKQNVQATIHMSIPRGKTSSMIDSPLLALVMLLVTAKSDKAGLLAVDAGGELLAHHAIAPAPSTATKYQHQAFIQ
jgi:hypothetical protein